MQDGQCQTGDMDMDAAIKVRKEPQGEARGLARVRKPRIDTQRVRRAQEAQSWR